MEKKAASKSNGATKRRYERTTPLGRVLNGVGKAHKLVNLMVARLQSWEHTSDPNLLAGLSNARSALASLENAGGNLEKLFKVNWTPPAKKSGLAFEVNEVVQIGAKYRDKYLKIYSPAVIENLVVSNVLDTGEIAVRFNNQPPFMVPKSHIERRRPSA